MLPRQIIHSCTQSSVAQRITPPYGNDATRRTARSPRLVPCIPERSFQGTSAEKNQLAKPSAPFTNLRLFLDSASVTQWELWLSTNMFYGITTNPSILEKDGQRCTLSNLTRLCRIGEGLGVREMQFQAWGDSAQSMVSVALDIFGMNPNLVVVKLPCTLEGFQAAALLRESDVRVTMTAMYTSSQVLLAQSVGAEYAAPYLGRMNDAYGNNQGFKQVVEMQRILNAQRASMRLLVASLRDSNSMASLAAEGCDTFTISPSVAGKLFAVSYTLDAVDQFEAAARRMGAYEEDEGATTSTLLQLTSRQHMLNGNTTTANNHHSNHTSCSNNDNGSNSNGGSSSNGSNNDGTAAVAAGGAGAADAAQP